MKVIKLPPQSHSITTMSTSVNTTLRNRNISRIEKEENKV